MFSRRSGWFGESGSPQIRASEARRVISRCAWQQIFPILHSASPAETMQVAEHSRHAERQRDQG